MNIERYHEVRSLTERLAEPLSAEDQTVQSMADTSPTKWHRAHTTWFFETFVLERFAPGYVAFDPSYRFLFNSYYEAVGPRHARPDRGVITRPGIAEVATYRQHVDVELSDFVYCGAPDIAANLIELGLHHEQQHQELLLMDIKHMLSRNPRRPVYGCVPWHATRSVQSPQASPPGDHWVSSPGGQVDIGHDGQGFGFDNETPRHTVLLQPYEISRNLTTCDEWRGFIDDGGYERPELWLSDGWAAVQAQGWHCPEYWFEVEGDWFVHELDAVSPVDSAAPVMHVSFYEADAFARWAGARLPLEAEWEAAAPAPDDEDAAGWYGSVWQWTASPYVAYPGFRPAAGAVGEYNGKFMVNQHVLRGSCLATPPGHARRTYRNFFPPAARWPFTGVRLARDARAHAHRTR
jgi:ergothioneine biosynthesis protein EgtB